MPSFNQTMFGHHFGYKRDLITNLKCTQDSIIQVVLKSQSFVHLSTVVAVSHIKSSTNHCQHMYSHEYSELLLYIKL